MNDCPFCAIDQKKIRILVTKEHTLVVLSNPRLMPCHLLVIPKRHGEKLAELHEQERKELWDTVMEFQEKIVAKIAPGCDIRQNYRPFLQQSRLKVNHLHIHLLPREFEDELYTRCMKDEKDIFKEVTKEEAERVKNILKE